MDKSRYKECIKMKISLIQSDIDFGQPKKNEERMLKHLGHAIKDNPDVIILPELWTTGYDLTRIKEIGDVDGHHIRGLFSDFAKKHRVKNCLIKAIKY
jgi:omega-amidase